MVYHLVQISMAYWWLQQKTTCLHACESAIMLNLAEVAYGGLTQAESKVFEQIIQSKVTTC
jgi:hypothetical protein